MQSIQTQKRPDLADRTLGVLLLATGLVVALYFVLKPLLPEMFQVPGSPLLQSAAIAGAILLLAPLGFSLAKRSGQSAMPNRWFIAHVVASLAGFALIAAHTAAKLDRPPALLLVVFLALAVSGAVARLRLSRAMASTLGRKTRGFATPDPALRAELQSLIARKKALLLRLEPEAAEGTFSVTLSHWLQSPGLAFAYSRLAAREASLMGTRRSVSFAQGFWRPLHMAMGWIFLAGMAVHIVVVLFFAGWAAGDREITWWHLTAW